MHINWISGNHIITIFISMKNIRIENKILKVSS